MHGFCFIIGTDTLVFRPACERAVKKTLLLLHRSHTIPTMSAPEPAVDKADERTQMAFCSTTAQVVASAFGKQLLGGPENFAGNAVVDALTGRSSFSSFPVAKWNNKNLLHLYDDKNQPIHTLLGPHKFQLTPLTQVYAHMQAAALRLYPDHVLIVPKRSEKVLGNQLHSIRTWWDQDLRPKFDLAQVCTFSVHVHDTSQFSSSAHCSREPLYSDVVLHSGQKMPHPQNTRSGRKPLCCLGVPGLRSFSCRSPTRRRISGKSKPDRSKLKNSRTG